MTSDLRHGPLFIEVCRRIRPVQRGESLVAARSTLASARGAGKEAKGNTGDPWAPRHLAEGKSLTLGDRDWTHKVLFDLLFSDKREGAVPPLAKRLSDEATEPMLLLAEAIGRGNSKTDGFTSRLVPIPAAMVRALFGTRPTEVAPRVLADIAVIDLALRNGLALVAAGGDREKGAKPHHARSQPAQEALRRQADALFFPELWQRLAATEGEQMDVLRLAFLEGRDGRSGAERTTLRPASGRAR